MSAQPQDETRLHPTESAGPPAGAIRPPLDLKAHLGALRRFWLSAVICTLLGAGLAAGVSFLMQPKYQASTTFFVATQSNPTNNPLQADEFAQRRINSYVGVVTSEKLAKTVLDDTGLPGTTDDLSKLISATADPDTVLMVVTVTDISPERALLISKSVAKNLDATIGQLDNRGTTNAVELRVISGPTLNPDPVSPRIKLNIAIGLLLGLAIGIAQALLRQQFDTSVRNREQLTAVSGLPVLGYLHFESSAKNSPMLRPHSTRSRRAEEFRQLRTNLRFVDAASPVKVLVVTSSVESEGKSTASANLAQAFAESGRRTLLVDGDLRRPRIESYLGIERAAGLTSVLIGEAEVSQVVQEWGPDGLEVLASGPLPPNPSELLGSPAMERFLTQVRADYDMVILDTPPVLPVTDAAITGVLADGVLLVVRHGKTRQDQVLNSITALRSVDARVLGAVMSMAPVTGSDQASSYYLTHPQQQSGGR